MIIRVMPITCFASLLVFLGCHYFESSTRYYLGCHWNIPTNAIESDKDSFSVQDSTSNSGTYFFRYFEHGIDVENSKLIYVGSQSYESLNIGLYDRLEIDYPMSVSVVGRQGYVAQLVFFNADYQNILGSCD